MEEDSGVETARAEDSGYVGGKDGNRTLQDEMDVEEYNQRERNTAPSDVPEGSKSEHRVEETSNHTIVAVGGGALGDVVKSDPGDGVKVSRTECDTGAQGVRSHSAGSEGGGGGVRSKQEKKLWDAVTTNSSDFNSWTALLQLVEQNCVLEPACKAFAQFLKLYPYCYGYWKKYSDLVKKLCGDEKAQEVLEEGVAAIPLSVDLWLHYTTFAISYYSGSPQGEELIRSVYDRAVKSCGLDFRSAKIWEAYMAWESGGGRQSHVMALYDKLLAIPTKELSTHFENFKKLLESSPSSQLLLAAEFQDISSQAGDSVQGEALLDSYVRKVILETRTAVYEKTMVEYQKRTQFELMIKRPYFHVKPLERLQLKNWRDYLDFEILEGNRQRIQFLFERCMIACALYEDFWSKYCKYGEVYISGEASSIYRRACAIHLRQKPTLHVAWAAFEEKAGGVETAREILANIDRAVPGVVLVRLRRIRLEIIAGRYSEADVLYQESLTATISLEMRNFYAWRYARFCSKFLWNPTKARAVMNSAIDMDPTNTRLYLQLLDLLTSGHAPPDMMTIKVFFENVASSPSLSDEVKESFLTRRQQLVEEFGGSITDLLEVTEKCEKVKRSARKRPASETDSTNDPAKKSPLTVAPPTSTPMGVAQPLTPQQQWAAYQQQWGGYNYTQPQQGYNVQGYYPPFSYAQQSTT